MSKTRLEFKVCSICNGKCEGASRPFVIKNTETGRKLYEAECSNCKKPVANRPLSTWHTLCRSCNHMSKLNTLCLFCNKEKPINRKTSKWCSEACCTSAYYYRHHESNKAKKRLIPTKPYNSEYSKAYQKKRKHDTGYRILANLRSRMSVSLKRNTKKSSILKYFNCSIEELKLHLESKFKEGMSWENYGKNGWHVDHIRPLSSFDLKIEENLKIAWHYTNLQPLWAIDNIKKGDKYET